MQIESTQTGDLNAHSAWSSAIEKVRELALTIGVFREQHFHGKKGFDDGQVRRLHENNLQSIRP
jgi:hypothetical protein